MKHIYGLVDLRVRKSYVGGDKEGTHGAKPGGWKIVQRRADGVIGRPEEENASTHRRTDDAEEVNRPRGEGRPPGSRVL